MTEQQTAEPYTAGQEVWVLRFSAFGDSLYGIRPGTVKHVRKDGQVNVIGRYKIAKLYPSSAVFASEKDALLAACQHERDCIQQHRGELLKYENRLSQTAIDAMGNPDEVST